jgi:hypothetical protein
MLVAPTLMQFSAATGAGVMTPPDLRSQTGTVALAVSCVEQAEVRCLMNDLKAACDPEVVERNRVLMEMDQAIMGLANELPEPETRLDRLARFLETACNADELPEEDLRNIGEFALAVDLGDWAKAESVVQSWQDNSHHHLSNLFVTTSAK